MPQSELHEPTPAFARRGMLELARTRLLDAQALERFRPDRVLVDLTFERTVGGFTVRPLARS